MFEKTVALLETEKGKEFLQPEILNNYAVLLAKEEKYTQAEAIFDKALTIATEESKMLQDNEEIKRNRATAFSIQYNKAEMFRKNNRTHAAAILFEELANINPLVVETFFCLHQIYENLGDKEKSQKFIDRAIAVCIKFPKVNKLETAVFMKVQSLIKSKNWKILTLYLNTIDYFVNLSIF